ncbi:BMP family ABC transporter substrate-binding protein [Alkalicoccus luteus]|uniref:BMP family ABC transporter substrate-binding protein n=1 Tax=Alkalicoccus luteus TaxID=1237094 RepID=A0A969PQ67_9BACI|nr:BMP family ABC transporter substrate-binding protein [Alkalicoccus luteus]NJP38337.1 BMP family ABC transporter substrate-binding protein [Alkalicoccus luteus]
MRSAFRQSVIVLTAGAAVAIIIVLSMQLLSSRVITEESNQSEASGPNISILTSDAIRDQSWGSFAFTSQVMIRDEFGIQAELHPELTTETLRDYRTAKEAEDGADMIIGHGREFAATFAEYAPQYPEVEFVSLHGETNHDNHTVYTFDVAPTEVLAMTAATIKSESGSVGVLSKYGDWRSRELVEERLQELDTELHYEVVEDRNDTEKAMEALERLRDAGADVIYSRGNTFNRYVIQQAAEDDFYVIGFIDDQSYLSREHVLTSIVNNVPLVYEKIMTDYLSEEGLTGGTVELSAEDGVFYLAPFGPMFSEADMDELKKHDSRVLRHLYDGSR